MSERPQRGHFQTEIDSASSDRAHAVLEERLEFPGCARPTLGVELEVSLVDLASRKLSPRAPEILAAIGEPKHNKPELFQTIVELNTDVCNTVADVRRDLGSRLDTLRRVASAAGVGIISTGTHPAADWRELPISNDERYQHLVASMQWPARRLLICGVHVHVGVKSGEHAVALTSAMSVFLPHLLALSASSPFWEGRDTGMASSRVKVFESLPTAGLPPRITNWSEFVQLMRTLKAAGAIKSIREIWWDIRPHPFFGTLEIRICDGVNTLSEICALTALAQCLVSYLQDLYDHGRPLPWLRGWTIKENKWRAARYGEAAQLIRNEHGEQIGLEEHVREWIEHLEPTAAALGCTQELAYVDRILSVQPSHQRQRRMLAQTGRFEGVVDALLEELETDQPYGA